MTTRLHCANLLCSSWLGATLQHSHQPVQQR